jgi:hypothetical protein
MMATDAMTVTRVCLRTSASSLEMAAADVYGRHVVCLKFPMFADDHDAQAASAERLKAPRDAGVTVRPGHHPAVLAPGPVPR